MSYSMMMISIHQSLRTIVLKVIIKNLSQYLLPGYDGESKGADSIE